MADSTFPGPHSAFEPWKTAHLAQFRHRKSRCGTKPVISDWSSYCPWSGCLLIPGKCLCLILNFGRQMSRHDMTFNYYLEANVAICHDLTLANFIFFLVLSHTSALGDRVARARLSLYCLPKISIICVTHIQIYLKFFSFWPNFLKSFSKVVKLSRQFRCGATCLRHVSQKKRFSRQMSRYVATFLFIYFR